MRRMEIKFERVFERDLDLLIMNLFCRKSAVCRLFLEKVELPEEILITDIKHSVKTVSGESDVEIHFISGGKRYAFLIEDKINASAQPSQYDRYLERIKDYKERGEITEGYVFLVAPDDYIGSNSEAGRYDENGTAIRFSSILKVLEEENDTFGIAILEAGKKKKMDSKDPDAAVTAFWQDYVRFCENQDKTNTIKLSLNDSVQTRGVASIWPTFRTGLKGTVIIHKSKIASEQTGWVDLQFTGQKGHTKELIEIIEPEKDGDMISKITGNSFAIGIKVDRISFDKDFDDYKKQMGEVCEAVRRLQVLVQDIRDKYLTLL